MLTFYCREYETRGSSEGVVTKDSKETRPNGLVSTRGVPNPYKTDLVVKCGLLSFVCKKNIFIEFPVSYELYGELLSYVVVDV